MGSSKYLEGITSTGGESALTTATTAGLQTGYTNDSVHVLVDSGASGDYFDDAIISGLRNRLNDYKVSDVPRKL